jgi:hypothetical protein
MQEQSNKKKKDVRRNIPINPQLYKQFKTLCVANDKFVKSEVEKMIKMYVEQHSNSVIKRRSAKASNE